jgi:hypothetical protein
MLFEKLLFFTDQGTINPLFADVDNSELGGVKNKFVETAPDALYGDIYDRELLNLLHFCLRALPLTPPAA